MIGGATLRGEMAKGRRRQTKGMRPLSKRSATRDGTEHHPHRHDYCPKVDREFPNTLTRKKNRQNHQVR